MERRINGKRILAMALAVALLLSMMPTDGIAGLLKVTALESTKSIVLFSDAFTDTVTAHHEKLTVAEDPNTAGNKVLQVGDNYARLWMQSSTGISLTEAKKNSGKLILEFYAQSAGSSLDVYALSNANDTWTGQEFADFTVVKGWNTIEIPVEDITADTIYGLSVYTGMWCTDGTYHYVDNVRVEWAEAEPVPEPLQGKVVLFDNAFASQITGHHASLTVADDPGTAGNKVLQVGDNYARLWMQAPAGISLTGAKKNAGKLILEFYAQSAASSLDVFVLDDVNDTYNGEEFLDFAVQKGWNTIEIPVANIQADTIYGVSVYTGMWTTSGVYHYVDDVRIEWGVSAAPTIQIDGQPAAVEVEADQEARLCVTASLSDGADTSALQYQWYKCDDAAKANPAAIEGATQAVYIAPTAEAGTGYYYCRVSAQGIGTVDSNVAVVTVKAVPVPPAGETLVLFDDAFADSIKAGDMSGVTVTADIAGPDGKTSSVIALGGGWSLSRFGTGANPIDISQIAAASGSLVFDMYASYATTDSVIRVYTAAWQGGQTVFTKALNAGWNTVTIPAAEIGSTDFYGIGILSHTGTCYVDNVRFEWGVSSAPTVQIDTQPVSAEVKVGGQALLSVAASLSDGSDAAVLQYQWYKCDDAGKTNPAAVTGATAATYAAPTAAAGVCYYYCRVQAEGIAAVESEAVSVTVEEETVMPAQGKVVLFDQAFTGCITGSHESLTVVDDPNAAGNKVLQVGNNYARLWMQAQSGIDLTEAKANSGKLILEFYAQSAGSSLDIYVLSNANDTWTGQEFADFTVVKGWNTIEIPVKNITADKIYGLSVYTGMWCTDGSYHYVDNVRFEWGAQSAASIRIDAQPASVEVKVGEEAQLSVTASLSDGADASGL